ncbi:MAG: hypothetical protein KCHDKBKB_00865 [Elusimicrobia bacterium]|nr:hypothetical protein [Elusimicrobiota bacterium]
MSPFGSSAVPLIIVALGILGVILSFLVADRKKSLISLGLAGLVILTGVIQLASTTITRFRWERRMKEIQRDRQSDLDELRQRMKDKPGDAPKAVVTPQPKKP